MREVHVDTTRFHKAAEQLDLWLRSTLAGERQGQVGVLEIAEAQAKETRPPGLILKVVQLNGVGPVDREHRGQPGIATQRGAALRPGQLHATRVEEFDDRINRRTETARLDLDDQTLALLAGEGGRQGRASR